MDSTTGSATPNSSETTAMESPARKSSATSCTRTPCSSKIGWPKPNLGSMITSAPAYLARRTRPGIPSVSNSMCSSPMSMYPGMPACASRARVHSGSPWSARLRKMSTPSWARPSRAQVLSESSHALLDSSQPKTGTSHVVNKLCLSNRHERQVRVSPSIPWEGTDELLVGYPVTECAFRHFDEFGDLGQGVQGDVDTNVDISYASTPLSHASHGTAQVGPSAVSHAPRDACSIQKPSRGSVGPAGPLGRPVSDTWLSDLRNN